MAIPTVNDVQAVETVLTNMLVGYQQDASRFVAMSVFPAVSVPHDSGTFFKFDKKYWFTDLMQKRAPGGDFAHQDFGLSTDTYATMQYALEWRIADEVRRNSQVPLDLETAAVQWLNQQSMIRKERDFASTAFATSTWNGGTDGTVTAKFSDYDDSDPVGDVLTALRTVSNATGYTPNTAVMGNIVNYRLLNHPDLMDRMKYVQVATQANIQSALASIFGIEPARWYVSQASYNSANPGQDATMAQIIDDDLLLCYVTPAPGMFNASAGYCFAWPGGGGTGSIYNYRDDDVQADKIKLKEQWDFKIVATDVGYLYPDCTD